MTQATATAVRPKFVLSGNTIEEVAMEFAELVTKTQPIEVIAAKKGDSSYGKWELGDGDGLTLQNKELAIKAGIPLYLGITVVLRKLCDPANYESQRAASVQKKAASIQRLEQQLAALKAGL